MKTNLYVRVQIKDIAFNLVKRLELPFAIYPNLVIYMKNIQYCVDKVEWNMGYEYFDTWLHYTSNDYGLGLSRVQDYLVEEFVFVEPEMQKIFDILCKKYGEI